MIKRRSSTRRWRSTAAATVQCKPEDPDLADLRHHWGLSRWKPSGKAKAFDPDVIRLLTRMHYMQQVFDICMHPVALQKFSPEAGAFAVRKLDLLVAELEALKQLLHI